jgi:hypothetical protein
MSVSFLAENKTMQTIRARVAFHSRQHGFDKCMLDILSPNQNISGSQLAELYAFWGDPLTSSDENFLRSCLAEASTVSGPIMLCGASLLTVVLGALCAKDTDRDSQVWCLEHDRHWANLIRSWLTEYRVATAHVIQSPARMFDEYVWYAIDTGRLAKTYQLVICDGDRSTPRGVIGTLKRLENRLDDRFTILARNVKEAAVLRSLNTWAKTNDAKIALIDKREGFLKLSRQPAAQVTETNPTMPPPARKAPAPGLRA